MQPPLQAPVKDNHSHSPATATRLDKRAFEAVSARWDVTPLPQAARQCKYRPQVLLLQPWKRRGSVQRLTTYPGAAPSPKAARRRLS